MMKTKGIFRGLLMAALVAVVFSCEKDEKSNPTISWSNPADIQYGVALSAEQLNATASVEGTFSYMPRIGTVLEAGAEQELTVNFTPEDKGSYKEVSASVLINVLPGEPEITWENPADIVYETALGETELNATANIAGTFVYTPELGTVLTAGNEQELMVAFTPEDTDNYQVISKTVLINVLKQDPVITWEQPMDMFFYMGDPQPLTEKQLNATANMEGTMNYIGIVAGATVLPPGKKELQAEFVPADADNYNTVTKSVTVHVSESAGIVTDIEGNKYHTVQIGEQVWMAENLRTTKLNDGTEITLYDGSRNQIPMYLWPDLQEGIKYQDAVGASYNWYVVETNKVCPSGWHVPSREEWEVMFTYLVNNGFAVGDGYLYNDPNLPTVSKALCSSNWNSANIETDGAPCDKTDSELINKTGFTALENGFTRFNHGKEDEFDNYYALWHSSSKRTYNRSEVIRIYGRSSAIAFYDYTEDHQIAIRCVKD
ncbi:fibrobacter succinogenes major paralogous domain-containing protein [Carboxylicivirga mesophila]|uniref:Fibrobacter succinogenes major paralogous domain-containing protein n=1 Tax=Carboxylicivirga mesophila TaxID=1166478 RepID=A0ABS5KFK1_9BACT|nr:fibrobacter succinogenes major paralogous domain-containing protein [Carboxylicivirga mesophila]MBS2213776.1 fibrobacter succinogenes major paralogous domain-containing protein [Carboxylicivirga mesophila]